jgi:hypothetical protein
MCCRWHYHHYRLIKLENIYISLTFQVRNVLDLRRVLCFVWRYMHIFNARQNQDKWGRGVARSQGGGWSISRAVVIHVDIVLYMRCEVRRVNTRQEPITASNFAPLIPLSLHPVCREAAVKTY